MVFSFNVGQRGQLSIEFILILSVVLILLQAIVIPMRDKAEVTANAISSISYLDTGIKEIERVFDIVNNSSSARIPVTIYVPKDSNIVILNNTVGFTIKIPFEQEFCATNLCTKALILPMSISDTEVFEGGIAGQRYSFIVQKQSGAVQVIR